MRKQTLFNILLIITTMAAVAILIAVIYFFQRSANISSLNAAKEVATNDTANTLNLIKTETEIVGNELRLLSEAENIFNATEDSCSNQLKALSSFISEEIGPIIRSNETGAINCSSKKSLLGKSVSGLNENELAISNIEREYFLKLLSIEEENRISVVYPLRDSSGIFRGTLATNIFIEELGDKYLQSDESDTQFLLLNSEGIILFSNGSSNIGVNYSEEVGGVKEELVTRAFAIESDETKGLTQKNGLVGSYAIASLQGGPELYAVSLQQLSSIAQDNGVGTTFLGGAESVLGLTMIIIVFGAVFVMLLIFYSNRIFFKPIRKISSALERATSGDLHAEVPIEDYSENDEFYYLSSGYNQMLKSVREHKEELEDLVSTRTKDLKETKVDLEIAKKELEDKVDELERLNQLMIGRETRMIELKDEIERLKKQDSNED